MGEIYLPAKVRDILSATLWNTAVWGIFLLGIILGPTSIVHTFNARRNANRSKVGKVGVGPAILGVLVTIWGAFVMWTVFHFVTTTFEFGKLSVL